MTGESPTREAVCQLVAEELAVPLDEVLPSKRLYEDFGITGDDASEFMEVFANRFDVDLDGFEFLRHFSPEASNPLWLLFKPKWLRELGSRPVSVKHLVEVAQRKKWFEPPSVR